MSERARGGGSGSRAHGACARRGANKRKSQILGKRSYLLDQQRIVLYYSFAPRASHSAHSQRVCHSRRNVNGNKDSGSPLTITVFNCPWLHPVFARSRFCLRTRLLRHRLIVVVSGEFPTKRSPTQFSESKTAREVEQTERKHTLVRFGSVVCIARKFRARCAVHVCLRPTS